MKYDSHISICELQITSDERQSSVYSDSDTGHNKILKVTQIEANDAVKIYLMTFYANKHLYKAFKTTKKTCHQLHLRKKQRYIYFKIKSVYLMCQMENIIK